MYYERIVITTKDIAYNNSKILNVSHDEDGIWQFLGDANIELSEEDAIVVSLDEILQFDPTLL